MLEVILDSVVNSDCLTINREPIIKYIFSYPQFTILKTIPENNNTGANLTEFTFCSNTPIFSPAKEDYDNYFKSNLDYEISRWSKSYKVKSLSSWEKCEIDEFRTNIYYGLMPLSDYKLEFNLEDVFNQKINHSLGFTTSKMPNQHLSFYHFQPSYNVTSTEKTKLTYAAKNMNYVDLHICKLSAFNFLSRFGKGANYSDPPSGLNCLKVYRDRIDLPARYWIKNYFKVDLQDYFKAPTGHYILTFSNPNYTGYNSNSQVYERSYLTVTNLAVTEKKIKTGNWPYGTSQKLTSGQLSELNNLYWVTDLSTLKPVSGAKIDVYKQYSKPFNLTPAGSYTTNSEGLAFTDTIYDLGGIIVTKGSDSTIILGSKSTLQRASSAFSARKIYLYTDKPIYRPTEEVFIKGIYRLGYDGDYDIYQDSKINLKVYNSRGDEISNQELTVNNFGTFNTKIILPQGSPLGTYRICAKEYSCSYFDIQEYVPAAFEVKVKSDKEEYISKDKVNLDIEANYYFGVPLEGGEVSYTISSQNYYFDKYSDGYFNFGSQLYYWSSYPYGDKFILRGKASLDNQGKAQISQLIDFEKLFKDSEDRKSKIIVFDVTVKNSQGRSVSSQKSLIVHAGDFYLGLKADKSFLAKNEKFNFKVKSVDIQGKETQVRNVNLKLYKVKWNYSKRLGTGGSYYYEWEKQRELIRDYNFNTDRNGNFTQALEIAEGGSYEAEAMAVDKRGNSVWSSSRVYVYGEGAVSIRPTKDTNLEIEVEKTSLNVGEQGEIIIKSPYQNAKALISIERGEIFDYEIKEIQGNLYNYKFEIKEEYIPNIYVSVLLIAPEPAVKYGKVEFKINTNRKELNIETKANKKYYLPGEEVVFDILVKDYQGKPVSAELSLSVVDLSVLALKGNPKKNPLIFFYNGFPLTVSTSSNLKNILIEKTLSFTKGGGGMAPEMLSRKKRGVFKETAFWQAVVRTDKNGKAQVKFTLPDNLTTWQSEVVGLTKDLMLGVDYQEFTSRKELMVVPLKPRFIVPGDVFYIGAKIFNQSQNKQRLEVSFESQTLTLNNDKLEKKITLNPNKDGVIYFKVVAPHNFDSGQHQFILSAKGQQLEDTVEQTIDITSNDTYEVTATANYTEDNISKEYVFLPDNVIKDKGNLSIKSSATLAVFLSDSLNYLLKYPYGCSEQIASKLNAIAIVQKGLDLPNLNDKFELDEIKYNDKEYSLEEVVVIGSAELYNNQQWNGGFAYWRGSSKADFYLTLHVVDALNNLSSAGFDMNQTSLSKASNYLLKQITTNPDFYRDKNTVILTVYTLSKLPNFNNQPLKNQIIQIANNDLFIQERINNDSLAYLAILLTNGYDKRLKNKVFDALDNRVNIDSRGTFLEASKDLNWRYYETTTKNTALYLKALTANKERTVILDKVLRWLLNSRAKDGAWGSTNNTLTVIDAFTDFLQWKRETESDFTLELSINDQIKDSFDFNSETILDQLVEQVPLQDLEFNKVNAIQFSKTNHNKLPNNFYYDLVLKYYLPADQIPPRDEGFSIIREFYKLDDKENKTPIREAKVGEILRGHLQITIPESRRFVMIEDYIPAGMEIVNLELATEEKSLRLQEQELKGREFIPDFKEIRDDKVFLYREQLSPGVYEFDYYTRSLIQGKFIHLPTQISEMYFPENFGRTDGRYFEIK